MESKRLITEDMASHFPFLCQNIYVNMTEESNPIEMPKLESSIPSIQNKKSRLSNFYKCISRI